MSSRIGKIPTARIRPPFDPAKRQTLHTLGRLGVAVLGLGGILGCESKPPLNHPIGEKNWEDISITSKSEIMGGLDMAESGLKLSVKELLKSLPPHILSRINNIRFTSKKEFDELPDKIVDISKILFPPKMKEVYDALTPFASAASAKYHEENRTIYINIEAFVDAPLMFLAKKVEIAVLAGIAMSVIDYYRSSIPITIQQREYFVEGFIAYASNGNLFELVSKKGKKILDNREYCVPDKSTIAADLDKINLLYPFMKEVFKGREYVRPEEVHNAAAEAVYTDILEGWCSSKNTRQNELKTYKQRIAELTGDDLLRPLELILTFLNGRFPGFQRGIESELEYAIMLNLLKSHGENPFSNILLQDLTLNEFLLRFVPLNLIPALLFTLEGSLNIYSQAESPSSKYNYSKPTQIEKNQITDPAQKFRDAIETLARRGPGTFIYTILPNLLNLANKVPTIPVSFNTTLLIAETLKSAPLNAPNYLKLRTEIAIGICKELRKLYLRKTINESDVGAVAKLFWWEIYHAYKMLLDISGNDKQIKDFIVDFYIYAGMYFYDNARDIYDYYQAIDWLERAYEMDGKFWKVPSYVYYKKACEKAPGHSNCPK